MARSGPRINIIRGGQQLYTSYTVTGTPDSPLFRTARAGYYGDFSYTIPISNGTYKLTLKFAEVQYSAAGQRIFNVSVNDNPVLSNFDIVAQGGFYQRYRAAVFNRGHRWNCSDPGARRGNTGLLSAIQLMPTGSVPRRLLQSQFLFRPRKARCFGQQMSFTANVAGAANPAVTWSASAAHSGWIVHRSASHSGYARHGYCHELQDPTKSAKRQLQ